MFKYYYFLFKLLFNFLIFIQNILMFYFKNYSFFVFFKLFASNCHRWSVKSVPLVALPPWFLRIYPLSSKLLTMTFSLIGLNTTSISLILFSPGSPFTYLHANKSSKQATSLYLPPLLALAFYKGQFLVHFFSLFEHILAAKPSCRLSCSSISSLTI